MKSNRKLPQLNRGPDVQIADRICTYGAVSTELALLSDQRLSVLLSKATPIGTSIGGTAVSMEIGGTRIFVKKIPLTDLERRPENIMSTANLFGLPSYCQYGLGDIGSPGFGAWRELAANIMSTNWVLTGECANFPLMYHWRVLPGAPHISDEHKNIDDSVNYWNGSPAVRARLEAKQSASAEILLFLEHIPQTLRTWFVNQVTIGGDAAVSATRMVESSLEATTSFMKSRGFLHFDGHFENILTDGQSLFFADFGLAMCTRFELSEAETTFFEIHRDYDRFYALSHLVHWLVVTLFGK
jgi:hypothetical protein